MIIYTSLATVTPSLTIFGDPYLLSRTTFLPFGPRVTPTRSASLLTPVWNGRKHKLPINHTNTSLQREIKLTCYQLQTHLKLLNSRAILVEIQLLGHCPNLWRTSLLQNHTLFPAFKRIRRYGSKWRQSSGRTQKLLIHCMTAERCEIPNRRHGGKRWCHFLSRTWNCKHHFLFKSQPKE